jgi:hypothetical protein
MMSDERPIPTLNPEALKTERKGVDLGTEAESDGYNHVAHAPGRAPANDEQSPAVQPTAGASPPAR